MASSSRGAKLDMRRLPSSFSLYEPQDSSQEHAVVSLRPRRLSGGGAHKTSETTVLEIKSLPSELEGPVSTLVLEVTSDPAGEDLGASKRSIRNLGMYCIAWVHLKSTACNLSPLSQLDTLRAVGSTHSHTQAQETRLPTETVLCQQPYWR